MFSQLINLKCVSSTEMNQRHLYISLFPSSGIKHVKVVAVVVVAGTRSFASMSEHKENNLPKHPQGEIITNAILEPPKKSSGREIKLLIVGEPSYYVHKLSAWYVYCTRQTMKKGFSNRLGWIHCKYLCCLDASFTTEEKLCIISSWSLSIMQSWEIGPRRTAWMGGFWKWRQMGMTRP